MYIYILYYIYIYVWTYMACDMYSDILTGIRSRGLEPRSLGSSGPGPPHPQLGFPRKVAKIKWWMTVEKGTKNHGQRLGENLGSRFWPGLSF